ncbi:MAG: carboxypeptidase-like regulatory domain-containing protein [Syntrophaceae bacterium]|nr:carboxypeptidase-like regulatory domain-containing protein [Deltaproteobacteria bacterium]
MKKVSFTICVCTAVIFLVIGTVRCGGGGGGGGDGGNETGGGGSVTITDPGSSGYSTVCNSVLLSGEAFISPTWSGCCSGSAETLTGVTVTWTNETTGESGKASQYVRICSFFFTPYLCEHTWMATIPLALGDNRITVVAADPSNRTGQDTITIYKPTPSYSITGKVANQNGVGMPGIKVTVENAGTATSLYAYTGRDGTYSFDCMESGSFKLTPASAISYAFWPSDRTFIVSGSDVTGQDFSVEAYFISGRATYANGVPIQDYVFRLTGGNTSAGNTTDSGGSYIFLVPNGTYTIEPSGWAFSLGSPLSFWPTSRTVTVDHADVPGQDFMN